LTSLVDSEDEQVRAYVRLLLHRLHGPDPASEPTSPVQPAEKEPAP
jgi:hypothetical protein